MRVAPFRNICAVRKCRSKLVTCDVREGAQMLGMEFAVLE